MATITDKNGREAQEFEHNASTQEEERQICLKKVREASGEVLKSELSFNPISEERVEVLIELKMKVEIPSKAAMLMDEYEGRGFLALLGDYFVMSYLANAKFMDKIMNSDILHNMDEINSHAFEAWTGSLDVLANS